MSERRIPPDATVSVNVRSLASALRDLKTLAESGALLYVLREGIPMLADRVEEMYWEQQER